VTTGEEERTASSTRARNLELYRSETVRALRLVANKSILTTEFSVELAINY